MSSPSASSHPLLDRLGIPPSLRWGFAGLLVFMIGDGVESGYLAAFLEDRGFGAGRVALVFTVYGITAAAAAWLSAALSDVFGPRKVMFTGAAIWIVFHAAFVWFGVIASNYPALLVTYAVRGLGYPLFAYGFLVWAMAAAPARRMGTAAGWFWFAFSAGFAALGPQLANGSIRVFGELASLWLALLVIVAGTLLMTLVRDPHGDRPVATAAGDRPVRDLLRGITIIWERPRIGVGAVIRMINSTPQYGFLVLLPTYYTRELGFSLSQWLTVSSTMFLSNIAFNLLSGVLGDRYGLARVVRWMGGAGCAVTLIAFHYVPLWTHSYAWALAMSAVYGATLAGFVPMSALMPKMAPDRSGAAMAALNLGAGLAAAAGPAIVGIFRPLVGVTGVMWIFVLLNALAALLTYLTREDADGAGGAGGTPARAASAGDPVTGSVG